MASTRIKRTAAVSRMVIFAPMVLSPSDENGSINNCGRLAPPAEAQFNAAYGTTGPVVGLLTFPMRTVIGRALPFM